MTKSTPKQKTASNDNKRTVVIFGHARPEKPDPNQKTSVPYEQRLALYEERLQRHTLERARLETDVESAKSALTRDGVVLRADEEPARYLEHSMAELRLLNHGRAIQDEDYLNFNANIPKNRRIPATCDCCGVQVKVSGDISLKVNRRYAHPAEDLESLPDRKDRCPRRAAPDARYEEKKLKREYEKRAEAEKKNTTLLATEKDLGNVEAVPKDKPTAKEQYIQNRANFYQPEHVQNFILIAKEFLGRRYEPGKIKEMLERADSDKIWGQISDPTLAPFQLLAQRGLHFTVQLTPEYPAAISFKIEQIYTTEDKAEKRLRPSDLRFYGRFATYHHNEIRYLNNLPGLDPYFLIRRDFTNAAQEISDHDKTWLPSKASKSDNKNEKSGPQTDTPLLPPPSTSSAEPTTGTPKDPDSFANYGYDRNNIPFIQINRATSQKLARLTRLREGIDEPSNDNARAQRTLQFLSSRVDEIMQLYGPFPEPKRRSASVSPVSKRQRIKAEPAT